MIKYLPDGAGILMVVFKSLWVENFKNQKLWSVANRFTKIKQLKKNIKKPLDDNRIVCQVV